MGFPPVSIAQRVKGRRLYQQKLAAGRRRREKAQTSTSEWVLLDSESEEDVKITRVSDSEWVVSDSVSEEDVKSRRRRERKRGDSQKSNKMKNETKKVVEEQIFEKSKQPLFAAQSSCHVVEGMWNDYGGAEVNRRNLVWKNSESGSKLKGAAGLPENKSATNWTMEKGSKAKEKDLSFDSSSDIFISSDTGDDDSDSDYEVVRIGKKYSSLSKKSSNSLTDEEDEKYFSSRKDQSEEEIIEVDVEEKPRSKKPKLSEGGKGLQEAAYFKKNSYGKRKERNCRADVGICGGGQGYCLDEHETSFGKANHESNKSMENSKGENINQLHNEVKPVEQKKEVKRTETRQYDFEAEENSNEPDVKASSSNGFTLPNFSFKDHVIFQPETSFAKVNHESNKSMENSKGDNIDQLHKEVEFVEWEKEAKQTEPKQYDVNEALNAASVGNDEVGGEVNPNEPEVINVSSSEGFTLPKNFRVEDHGNFQHKTSFEESNREGNKMEHSKGQKSDQLPTKVNFVEEKKEVKETEPKQYCFAEDLIAAILGNDEDV